VRSAGSQGRTVVSSVYIPFTFEHRNYTYSPPWCESRRGAST